MSAPAREHWAVKMRRELEELKSENNTLKLRVETLSRAKRQAKKLRSGGGGGDDDPDSDDSTVKHVPLIPAPTMAAPSTQATTIPATG